METNTATQAATDALSSAVVQSDLNFFQWAAKFMSDGGVFMWVIVAVWAVGLAVAVERMKRFRTYDIDGASLMNTIKKFVIGNEMAAAIQACAESNSLLALVMKNGLKRATKRKTKYKIHLKPPFLKWFQKLKEDFLQLLSWQTFQHSLVF